MDFEAALKKELETVTILNKRIYPLTAPEAIPANGVPYLIYISSEGVRAKSIGEGYLSGKTVNAELHIVAARYADLKAITNNVVALLIGMEQRVIGTGGPYIQELTYRTPVEIYESQPKLYRCVTEIQVYFEE
ncbi:DUF3168 domain-containing protein [Paenibacillus oenotherae]|uniref:DUF3168 domain-containing protein n=1 Tax=Paenibacillus oenotherae TaxID=1435645 RepID=A0ABS7D7N8_9BACL|nr:DUF3168 domain-containing protein [Paenibacillus oenotherae]MBW7475949.1 DUF3168 domain-containing protein [Paenibacillus oenotherae]